MSHLIFKNIPQNPFVNLWSILKAKLHCSVTPGVTARMNCLCNHQKLDNLKRLKLTRRVHSISDSVRDLVNAVFSNTVETSDHLTPEIKLRLITSSCKVWYSRGDDLPAQLHDPYWGFYWPGGQALSRYVLDYPQIVKNKTVLDFGSGCGATAIAAAMSDAKSVIANDISNVAAVAVAINAELNDKSVNICTEDVLGTINTKWDVVLVGDMFYDSSFAEVIASWLSNLKRQDVDVFIGDPGRLYFMMHPIKRKVQMVESYELPESAKEGNNGLTTGYVWQYR